jgi:hypothetical protein
MSYEEEDRCICGGGMHACRMRRRIGAYVAAGCMHVV